MSPTDVDESKSMGLKNLFVLQTRGARFSQQGSRVKGGYVAKLSWFKHYNTASEGQLIGDLIANKDYEAALLVYVIFEMVSQFEDPEKRGLCSVPINRIARRMNMKPSRIERVMGRISAISHSDLICTMDAEQPRNALFVVRNWLIMQETRGGKREAKKEQKTGEVRSKKEEERNKKPPNPQSGGECFDFDSVYKNYPRKLGKAAGMKKLKREIKNKEDFENLKIAVDNFCQLMKNERRAADKIPYFSTFANSWQDYLQFEQEDFSAPIIDYAKYENVRGL